MQASLEEALLAKDKLAKFNDAAEFHFNKIRVVFLKSNEEILEDLKKELLEKNVLQEPYIGAKIQLKIFISKEKTLKKE